MGYSVSQGETKFFIAAHNINYLHQCLEAFHKSAKKHGFFDITKSWEFTIDQEGNITNVNFEGEKLNEDYLMFDGIAPVVKDGSYIEMLGEDGDRWRWCFKDGKCHEIHAEYSFAPFE
jgi:hypothetical protein